ncbi:LpxL/LpxP family Kdo(2)-lipid IV(A) lauroyl/palmitoleoyl acyltransferase [Rheinheimera sediminis]|uniref:LpxL/LpxP family Kdo(2)-lipid IV(A) lauroyl/palmitoleoyl acyltransferase n=1 Tax=Rheinheimera sp. YQF-1 TaxID=2499626 RepID=UPI000FD82FE3|nr:LpxL/LpxP family Kdo(2)-lipid IV(A) lauroyl/palmitoleoyl acyltransferase [Rheinheimera sp. YQF-1]RVT44135.1 LpxL/LpxP family Kdo(2)-lipid IV(A) lauroyl/palmitoleoyl acyltransferase [Rheinheimera sp. YQF-1]
MVHVPRFRLSFLHPKHWPLWLGLGLMWILLWLPYPVLMKLGDALGVLLMKTLKSRVKVTRRNLELCFPDMPVAEREALVRQNFKETGKAAFETFMAWWWPEWRVRSLCHFSGYEHIKAVLDQGKGVLLLSGHFLSLEMIGRAFGNTHPSVGFYRPNDNEVMEYFQYHGRVQSNKYLIGKRDVRELINALNSKEVCFYLPDQDYGRTKAEFVPFFAVKETATTTGTLLFANSANCAAVPIHCYRLPDNKGYQVEALPAFDNFPSGDNKADVTRVNQWLEQGILAHPEQYMWLHRRFKTRPNPDDPSLY